MRALLLLLAGLALMAATPGPSPCPSPLPPAPEPRHASGLVILGPTPRCLGPQPFEPLAKASSDARLLVEAYPNDFGYPWADQIKRELVVSTTSVDGDRLARSWVAGGATVAAGKKTAVLPAPTVPVRLRTSTRSVAQMLKLEDDVIELSRAGVADTSAIHSVGADAEHDRIIVEVDHLNDALAAALVARFGTDAIAVRVDPTSANASLAGSRSDNDPQRWAYVALAAGALLLAIGVGLALRRRRA